MPIIKRGSGTKGPQTPVYIEFLENTYVTTEAEYQADASRACRTARKLSERPPRVSGVGRS